MGEDSILAFFAILLFIWFAFAIIGQIFLSTRGRKKSAERLLYVGLAFSLKAALSLTLYTAYGQDVFDLTSAIVHFVVNFALWSVPLVIAFFIYFIYFKVKRYEFKEVTAEERKERKKAEKLKRHNEEYEAKKDSSDEINEK